MKASESAGLQILLALTGAYKIHLILSFSFFSILKYPVKAKAEQEEKSGRGKIKPVLKYDIYYRYKAGCGRQDDKKP